MLDVDQDFHETGAATRMGGSGIEPSKKVSNYASNTLGLNVHNLSIERLLDCKFSENYFDVIYSHGVLEHMRKPDLFS